MQAFHDEEDTDYSRPVELCSEQTHTAEWHQWQQQATLLAYCV